MNTCCVHIERGSEILNSLSVKLLIVSAGLLQMCNNFHPNLRGGYATQGVICVQKHEDLHRFSKFETQFIKGEVQLLIFLLASIIALFSIKLPLGLIIFRRGV